MEYKLKDATITHISQYRAYDGWGDPCVETSFHFDRRVDGKRTFADIQYLDISRLIAYFMRNANSLHEITYTQFIKDMKGLIE